MNSAQYVVELAKHTRSLAEIINSAGLGASPASFGTRRLRQNLDATKESLLGLHALFFSPTHTIDWDVSHIACTMARRILELWLDSYWMTCHDKHSSLDAQARRSELAELYEVRKRMTKFADQIPGYTHADAERAKTHITSIDATIADLRNELRRIGVRDRARPDLTTLFTESNTPVLGFFWSYLSDIAHIGSLARQVSDDYREFALRLSLTVAGD